MYAYIYIYICAYIYICLCTRTCIHMTQVWDIEIWVSNSCVGQLRKTVVRISCEREWQGGSARGVRSTYICIVKQGKMLLYLACLNCVSLLHVSIVCLYLQLLPTCLYLQQYPHLTHARHVTHARHAKTPAHCAQRAPCSTPASAHRAHECPRGLRRQSRSPFYMQHSAHAAASRSSMKTSCAVATRARWCAPGSYSRQPTRQVLKRLDLVTNMRLGLAYVVFESSGLGAESLQILALPGSLAHAHAKLFIHTYRCKYVHVQKICLGISLCMCMRVRACVRSRVHKGVWIYTGRCMNMNKYVYTYKQM